MIFKNGDRVIYENDYSDQIEWVKVRSKSIMDNCYDLIIKYKDKDSYISYNVPEKFIEYDLQWYREQKLKKFLE